MSFFFTSPQGVFEASSKSIDTNTCFFQNDWKKFSNNKNFSYDVFSMTTKTILQRKNIKVIVNDDGI